MENKNILDFIDKLEEKGYLKIDSAVKKEELILKLSSLKDKLSNEELQNFETLAFNTFEKIKDNYFELGVLVGSILDD